MFSCSTKRRVTVLAMAAALGIAGCSSTPDSPTTEAGADQSAALPTLTVDTLSGGQIELNALAGQDLVLWFWAPW